MLENVSRSDSVRGERTEPMFPIWMMLRQSCRLGKVEEIYTVGGAVIDSDGIDKKTSGISMVMIKTRNGGNSIH